MAETVYKIKTEYTKDFYRKIGLYRAFSSSNFPIVAVIVIVSCYFGSMAIRVEPKSWNGWLALFSGLVLVPFVFFGLPYFLSVHGYKTVRKQNNGKPFYVTAEISRKGISCKNSLGQSMNVSYDQISKVIIKNGLFVVESSKQAIYLATSDFNHPAEEVYDFISRRRGIGTE